MGPKSAAGRLFLKSLADVGQIEDYVFAFSIGQNSEKSTVSIGSYQLDGNVVPGTPIVWHDLTNSAYWTLNFDGASFGNSRIPVTTQSLIVDTGTSYNLMPPKDFDVVKTMVEQQTGIIFAGSSYIG